MTSSGKQLYDGTLGALRARRRSLLAVPAGEAATLELVTKAFKWRRHRAASSRVSRSRSAFSPR